TASARYRTPSLSRRFPSWSSSRLWPCRSGGNCAQTGRRRLMSHTEPRRELIERVWTAVWGEGDVDALDKLLSPNYLRHSTDPRPQDLSAFKSSILATRSAFPDLVTTIAEVVLEGDRAAIRWHSSGTHENAF